MEPMQPRRPFVDRLRRGGGAFVIDNLFRIISRAGKLHPLARPSRHGVEVLRDIAYRDGDLPEHKLDVYRPVNETYPAVRSRPVVLYVHGGGFRILSKDTHWVMGLGFARRGYVVFNISYRLAPRHPYPAALEDAVAAYLWVARHAAEYGGDPSRLVLAGESAGANLVAALAVCASYARPEPFARAVFESSVRPTVVMPACGILQVSDPERFGRRRKLPRFLVDRMTEVHDAYLGRANASGPGGLELADPLTIIERGRPERPLPAFFIPVGTRDPLLDDTRRLKTALDAHGVPAEARYYPGEVHAFHAMVFRKAARRCWADMFEFLDRFVDRS
jgi:acetyl esterase/lipase